LGVPRPSLSLAIVGADYPNKRGPSRRFEIALCATGDPVELRPEPKNPADPRAVAVFSARGVQLGYLTAERAPWIGGMLAQGRELQAIFQAKAAWGCVIRVGFDGEEPSLPAAEMVTEETETSDYWRDEIWPGDEFGDV